MFIQTSRDILNITLSVSVLAVAIALTWLLSEFIGIFRDVRKTIKEVKDAIVRVESAITKVGDKVVQSVMNLRSLLEVAGTVATFVKERKAKKKSQKTEIIKSDAS